MIEPRNEWIVRADAVGCVEGNNRAPRGGETVTMMWTEAPAQRITDSAILSLVGKWLRACVMKDGVVVRTKARPREGQLAPC